MMAGFDQHLVVRSNTFREHTSAGLYSGYSVIDELSGNRFIRIRAAAGATMPAAAVVLSGNSGDPAHYGQILSGRGNAFLGNDLALFMMSNTQGGASVPASRVSNFGDATTAGANVFRCNGTAVRIDLALGAAVPLAGNGWDRPAPTVVTGSSAPPPGTDVFLAASGWPGVTTDPAHQATDACP
jgi:hypothetical protein